MEPSGQEISGAYFWWSHSRQFWLVFIETFLITADFFVCVCDHRSCLRYLQMRSNGNNQNELSFSECANR